MARISILRDEVQAAVSKLAPLFLEAGNLAGLVRRLNESAAAVGLTGTIHANRLSAFFADDPERGINDGTFKFVQAALEAIAPTPASQDLMAELAQKAQLLLSAGTSSLAELARSLALPPAVVRAALGQSLKSQPLLAGINAPKAEPAPDWSYQDLAVSRVMDALRRRPKGRIGLILPTGAGKTRVALRIILETLAANPLTRVLWVTHRKTLKRQAFRQLTKLLRSPTKLPPDADKLANRIIFAMVHEAKTITEDASSNIGLVVVDEAHHAAAPTYAFVLNGSIGCPALLLTATPNRPDALPIGIDEVAFTTTYRELADRRVIMIPQFLPFVVDNFEWDDEDIDRLVDWVLDETADRFRKVLVLAPQVSRVEEFYERLVRALRNEPAHPLVEDDIGYIHGTGNSHGVADEDFLERFEDKPRAILVSAQMLLEGFDDPSIDTVILTYSTSSVIRLMQAAGRAVRHHPGKTAAYVVQADAADLAYRFDQRWLYQELDDYLRPEIIDAEYRAPSERRAVIERLLTDHNVDPNERDAALREVDSLSPDEEVRLLFFGKPYFGNAEGFVGKAQWGVFVETPTNSAAFRQMFNAFSAAGALLSDPTDFIAQHAPALGIEKDLRAGSTWRQLGLVLTACYCAREEVYGTPSFGLQGNRPKPAKGPTTWLHYATFRFRPAISPDFLSFLADCYNRQSVERAYLGDPEGFAAAIKIPLPLGGSEALLLGAETYAQLDSQIRSLSSALRLVSPADRFAALAAHLAIGEALPLPRQFAARIELFLDEGHRASRTFNLNEGK
jgi:superfamily II DNA or RNA helicase